MAIPRLIPAASRPGIAWDANMQALAQRIFTAAYDDVDKLGGDVSAYGSAAWLRAWQANGEVWSFGSTLPFPTVDPASFPVQQTGPAPGEIPFDQCANFRPDGDAALRQLEAQTAAWPEGVIVASTGLTKGQMRSNVKIDYNAAALAFGCETVPYPEVIGLTPSLENAPPLAGAPSGPVNTLNGAPLDESGNPVGGGPTTGGGTPAIDTGVPDNTGVSGGPLPLPPGIGAPGLPGAPPATGDVAMSTPTAQRAMHGVAVAVAVLVLALLSGREK